MAKKKATKKKATKKKVTRKPNPALLMELDVSPTLYAVIKKRAVSRPQAVKLAWDYIKKNDLQNPDNKRNIFADSLLKPIFGKNEVTMFELTKLLSKHLK